MVTESLIKKGERTEAALNFIGKIGAIARVEIEFHRTTEHTRCIGMFAKNRLTADDDEIDLAGDFLTRPKNVLQLGPVHLG